MASVKVARRARLSLDRRLNDFGSASRYAPPQWGWVRAIRDALGMSAADLGRRMNMTAPAVFALEHREVQGGARLETLSRAAEAMDCTLVYAFIPNHGLEKAVREQAEKLVRSTQHHVDTTMALENQAVSSDAQRRMFEESLEAVLSSSRNIWREQ